MEMEQYIMEQIICNGKRCCPTELARYEYLVGNQLLICPIAAGILTILEDIFKGGKREYINAEASLCSFT